MNTETKYIGRATYSPEDNKLRLYPFARLSPSDYARVKSAGFGWAPKQELFVSPKWTPEREDLLCEMCGSIDDEDTSLVDRAEERAERFEDYSEKRSADAEQAHKTVAAIADNIPLGQPILIGHHSEKHARKDAEKIENGMRKAVKMWETSKYWVQRAAGALRHAKYKELPDVRARRIKGLEADRRKWQRYLDSEVEADVFWNQPGLTPAKALAYAGGFGPSFLMPRKEGDRPDFNQQPSAYNCLSGGFPNLYAHRSFEEIREVGCRVFKQGIERASRWILHYDNRLTYEKAMLEEQGASELIAKKPRPTQLPICNYRSESITIPNMYHRGEFETLRQMEMTAEQFQHINKDQRGTRICESSHRIRIALVDSDGEIRRFPSFKANWVCVFLTDSKTHEKPKPGEPVEAEEKQILPSKPYTPPERTKFDDLKDSLKAGVKVVSANQLFPTPREIARRMTDRAGLLCGRRILEPSAGMGDLVRMAFDSATGPDCCRMVAVEINHNLAQGLRDMRNRFVGANEANFEIHQTDFLQCNGNLGKFDIVLMNPPFENASDIKHILHARTFLKPGGKIVAICANGPRQAKELQPLADSWEALPDDAFAASGTNVRTVLLTIKN